MKNKKYNLNSGKILLLLLGVFSTFLSLGQAVNGIPSQYISGITSLTKPAGSGPMEVRFLVDKSVAWDYPSCYTKRDSVIFSTDSTVWRDFQNQIIVKNGDVNINDFFTTTITFHLNHRHTIPELANFSGGQLSYMPSIGGEVVLDGDDVTTLTNKSPFGYDKLQANSRIHYPPTPAVLCGSIRVDERFFNVVAQFRTKPTPQKPNGDPLPYYCNGGGSVPTFSGGYISSGGWGGGGSSGGASSGSTGSNIQNLCTCGGPVLGGPVDPSLPVDTVCAPGEFNQKIDADWPGANEDYMHILCDLSVERNGIEVYKGVTSSEGHFKIFKIKANDKIVLRSTKEMDGFAKGSFIFTAPQPTPIKINISPNFVSDPPKLD